MTPTMLLKGLDIHMWDLKQQTISILVRRKKKSKIWGPQMFPQILRTCFHVVSNDIDNGPICTLEQVKPWV